MWNKLKDMLGFSQPVVPTPDDMHLRIEHNLGVLTDAVLDRYSVRKAMSVRLRMSSATPKELSDWLSATGRIVDTAAYVPEPWKAGVRVERMTILDDYMTHEGYVISLPTWFEANKPRIARIVKAFQKLEEDDRDYYGRMYNSVLRDIDSLLTGIKAACN